MSARPYDVNLANGTIVCGPGFRVEDAFPGEGTYCSLVSDDVVNGLLWLGVVLYFPLLVAAAVQTFRIARLMPRSKRPLRQVLLIHALIAGHALACFVWNLGRVLTRNSSDPEIARSWTYKYGGGIRVLCWAIPNA